MSNYCSKCGSRNHDICNGVPDQARPEVFAPREVTPESFRVASTLCIDVDLTHMAAAGHISIRYDTKKERCGVCLICVLILQFPANDSRPPTNMSAQPTD